MEKTEKKFATFAFWFVVLQPIVDILTSIMIRFVSPSFTIGILVRTIFIAFIAVYLLFFYDGKHKNIFKIFLVAIGAYGAVSVVTATYFSGIGTLVENAKMYIKTFYFLFALLFFFAMYLKYRVLVTDWALVIVFVIYTGSIFLSAVTDTSFVTYAYAEGYCGWFYAGNEVGAIVSILAVIALLTVMESKSIALKIIVPALLGFAATYIGTKVPFYACIGAVIVPLVMYCGAAIIKKDKTFAIKSISVGCTLVLIAALFFCNSPIMKNNETMKNWHYNNRVTEKLESINSSKNQSSSEQSASSNPVTSSQAQTSSEPETSSQTQTSSKPETSSQAQISSKPNASSQTPSGSDKNKYDNVSIGDKIYVVLNWILSDRLDMVKPAVKAYEDANVMQILFGLGYNFETANGRYSKQIEMDFLALIINHGLIGFLIYMIAIFWFAVACLKAFFKNIKKFFEMRKEVAYFYSILIALGSAFLAGHVLVAPAVSIYIAIIVVNLYACLQKRCFDATEDTVTNGGEIEKN